MALDAHAVRFTVVPPAGLKEASFRVVHGAHGAPKSLDDGDVVFDDEAERDDAGAYAFTVDDLAAGVEHAFLVAAVSGGRAGETRAVRATTPAVPLVEAPELVGDGAGFVRAVSVLADGALVVAGGATGDVGLGDAVFLQPAGMPGAFVARFDLGGVVQWTSPLRCSGRAGQGSAEISALAVDEAAGTVLIGGSFGVTDLLALAEPVPTDAGTSSNGFLGVLRLDDGAVEHVLRVGGVSDGFAVSFGVGAPLPIAVGTNNCPCAVVRFPENEPVTTIRGSRFGTLSPDGQPTFRDGEAFTPDRPLLASTTGGIAWFEPRDTTPAPQIVWPDGQMTTFDASAQPVFLGPHPDGLVALFSIDEGVRRAVAHAPSELEPGTWALALAAPDDAPVFARVAPPQDPSNIQTYLLVNATDDGFVVYIPSPQGVVVGSGTHRLRLPEEGAQLVEFDDRLQPKRVTPLPSVDDGGVAVNAIAVNGDHAAVAWAGGSTFGVMRYAAP